MTKIPGQLVDGTLQRGLILVLARQGQPALFKRFVTHAVREFFHPLQIILVAQPGRSIGHIVDGTAAPGRQVRVLFAGWLPVGTRSEARATMIRAPVFAVWPGTTRLGRSCLGVGARPVARTRQFFTRAGSTRTQRSLVRQNRDVTTDDQLLADATDARVRMEEAQRALSDRRSEFDDAVRELHRAGASLGEVVTGLGISEVEASRILGRGPKDLLVCSFCGASHRDVASLIAGPFVYICGGCVAKAVQAIKAEPQHGPEATEMILIPATEMSDCAFCGKERYQTEHLVTAPRGGRICDECLDLCSEIIAEERGLSG